MNVGVVGGGVFGTAAAVALASRGHSVVLHEAGTVPRPEAASTDISKLVRADYGRDRFYRDLGLEAISGWERWNRASPRPLYHPDGLCVLASSWEEGGFEHDSAVALAEVGAPIERFEHAPIAAWRWDGPGYVNRRGGWAESGAVVTWLAARARAAGVEVREGASADPSAVAADVVVVAAGVWSSGLVPELGRLFRVVGQPVFHLAPADPAPWRAPVFLPWAADIARTGWYGFPANTHGLVKIANHGAGLPLDADAPRTLGTEWDGPLRAFLDDHLPALSDAPIVARRRCFYADTFDGDFVIDRLPRDPRIVVATGGSGHAFKFAPVLGDLVAHVVEGRPDPRLARFRWREPGARRTEHARHDPG